MIIYMNLFVFAFMVFCVVKPALQDGTTDENSISFFLNNRKLYKYTVIFLFVVAFLVRTYQFGIIPSGINQDEAMAAVDAYSLSIYGTDRFGMPFPVYFTAWGFAQMNVLQSYLMIPFIKILGLSALSARLPMLIVSLISLLAVYLFVRSVCGNKALSVLFVMAINPWHIMLSRWALESNLYPAFILFALYFLHESIRKSVYLYISMLFFGLSMYAYGIAYFATPLLMLALAVYFLTKKIISVRTLLICIFFYLFIAWPIFGVMIVNYFKLDSIYTPIFTIPYFPDAIRMNDLLPFSLNIPRQAADNLYSLLNISFFQFPDLPWNSIAEYGPLYLFSMPLIICGYHLISKRDEPGIFILKCWLAVGIVTGIVVNNANINRINVIFFPLIILCGLGLHYVVFEKHNNKLYINALPVIAYTISFVLFVRAYFGTEQKKIAGSYYDGFGQAIIYAEEQDSSVLYITANTQYISSYNVSEILTMFHAKTDAKYFQGKEKGLYNLPYELRYRYVNFYEDYYILNDPKGLYIFSSGEAYLFSEQLYDIKQFGQYFVGRLH